MCGHKQIGIWEIAKITVVDSNDVVNHWLMTGADSSWSQVTSGIPQGSVLGPLLFLLFINDMPDDIMSSIKIFADDTKVYKDVQT